MTVPLNLEVAAIPEVGEQGARGPANEASRDLGIDVLVMEEPFDLASSKWQQDRTGDKTDSHRAHAHRAMAAVS